MAISLLAQTIDQLSREKGIDPEIVIAALEDAMVVAARKYYKTAEELRSQFDRESGNLNVYAVRKVAEPVTDSLLEISLGDARRLDPKAEIGGEVHIPKPTEVLGRIAAQTAKQVIFQKVREAERDIVYAEYNGRVGELVHCVVKRLEGPEVIVELGRHEARMPRREQSRLETYHIGDRVRGVIKEVDRAAKGPQVVVSRADPLLVQRLFEMEVPEIYDGTVQTKAIAREAGERTKIAVQSKDRDVDAVGACVGMKGMRVQSIIRELRGEKIDIIEWNEDPVGFATNALSPAKVSRVSIVDLQERHLEVVVEDSQLSLAIGKKGQNVRLASKLLDWRIDIKSEEEKRREVEAQMAGLLPATPRTPLEELAGLGAKTKEKLGAHGVSSVEELAGMTPEQLMEIPGIGEKMVQKIAAAVKEHFEPAVAAAPAGKPEAAGIEVGAEPPGPARETAPDKAAAEEAPEETEVAAETAEPDSGKAD
ncbi:MAG: transcription termination/antitermination protein NusA [Acidobacteria bacterium]|nr:transcription termination/antitermination protein NusA [Acidobacteriota bacterium]